MLLPHSPLDLFVLPCPATSSAAMPPQGHHLSAAGTHSFVPSLDADEMKLFDVQRVPQNAGNTVEMQVSHTCSCNRA